MSFRGGAYKPPAKVAVEPAKPAESLVPHWRLKSWFPDLNDIVIGQLRQIHQEILKANNSMNILPNRTLLDADAMHIADSIIGGRIVLGATKAQEIFDIGSGSGLPALVMAILDPNRKFIVVEKDERKIEFLKGAITRLQLKNVSVFAGRFEELKDNTVEAAVTRDFMSITKIILSARKPCKLGADFFHFKTDSWVSEVADIPSQVCVFWAPKLVKEYNLPIPSDPLAIVVTKKIG